MFIRIFLFFLIHKSYLSKKSKIKKVAEKLKRTSGDEKSGDEKIIG